MVSMCRDMMNRTAKMGTAALLSALVLLVMAVPAWADGKKPIESSGGDVEWSGGIYIDNENGNIPEIEGKVTVKADTTYEVRSGVSVNDGIEIEDGITLTIVGQTNSTPVISSTIGGDGTVVFASGKVTVNGRDGEDSLEYGNSGVDCDLIIKDGDVTISGGRGGDGEDGEDGGNDSDGEDGEWGGDGGDGVHGNVTIEGGKLTVYGGDGGDGGIGGNGGDAGSDEDDGGDGGVGGDGGSGGDGIYGKAIVKGGILTVFGGNGGDGRVGGNGGEGGENGSDGEDGENGEAGYAGYGIKDDVFLEGGTLTVKGGEGYFGGEAYDGTVKVASGYLYSDGTNNDLTGELNPSEFGGTTLKPIPAAEIGTTGYASVQAAFDAAKAGDTVKLLRDVTTANTVEATKGTEQKPVILDLNGHGICFESEYKDGRSSVIMVESGAALTLKDSAATRPIHKITIGEDGFGTAAETVSAAGTDTDSVKYITGGYLTGGYARGDQVGGGVTIDENAVFTMTGGTICGNSTSREGTAGGVFVCNDAKFTMTGGRICNNIHIKGTYHGGGGVRSNGIFNMSGGSITENTARYGGGVYVRSGTFTLSGTADIAGNTAEYHGGGVNVYEGTFQMKGGRITENTVKSGYSEGGGVFVSNSGTFSMTNGEITGNSADSKGGGVYLEDGDEDDHATFNISGGAKVTGNTAGGAKNNVYIYDDGITILTVTGTLTGELGVSMVARDDDKGTYVPTAGVFTSGLDGNGSDLNFFSDSDEYAVGLNDNKEAVIAGDPVTIAFNANGGSGTMASRKVPKGVKATLSANSFTAPAKAEFVCWNTKADGSGTAYPDKAVINVSADTTLYAQWKQKSADPVDPGPGKKDEKISESTIPGGTGKIVVYLKTDDNGDTGYSVKDVSIPVDLAVSLLSEDEKKAVMGGETLSVTLEVSEIKGSAMSEQDKKDAEKAEEAVKEKTGLVSAGNGMILDIKLFKQIGTGDKKEVEPVAGSGKVTFTVEVPADMVNADGSIIRTFFLVHILDNGNAVIVNSGTGTSIPAATDSFSSWYLTYVDEKKDNGGNDKPKDKVTTRDDNQPMAYSEDTKGDFRIGYYHEIPFFGKVKPDLKLFGEITVSYNGATYKASKIKVNKKKCLIQITGLEGADKDTVKALKKATKGAKGLSFKVNPYYVRDTDAVTPKFKKDGSLKSVKVNINGKDYKAKKGEFSYDAGSKTVTFTGDNLKGSHKLP